MLDSQTSDREDGKLTVTEEHDLQILRNESPEAGLRDQPEAMKVNSNTPTYVTGYKLLIAMAALNLSAILINLDSSILSTATPTITDEFHSVKDIGCSALQPLTGKLFTYFSNKVRVLPNHHARGGEANQMKRTYIIFLILFEVGSLICGLAKSSPMFIAGRAIAGAGGAGLFNGSMIIVYAMVEAQKRPVMMGIMIGISQIGLIAGPLIGGALTQYSTWRWCFFINLPIGGFACILLALVYIPEQMPKPKVAAVLTDRNIVQKFDVVSSAILIGSVVQLLLALHYGGGEYPWNSATVIGLFSGFAVATILFVVWEYRAGENATIPLKMLTNRVVASASMVNIFLFGVTYIATYSIPIFFQSILGDSPMESGIHMLPSMFSSIFFTVISGMMVTRLGYYLPFAVFAAILLTVGSGLMSTWSPTTRAGEWIGYQILYGSGRGLGMQMSIVAIQTAIPPTQVAVALTVLVFFQGLAVAVLISIGNTVFDSTVVGQIAALAPDVNPRVIIAAGATAYRSKVSAEDLPNVVKAWATGFQRTMYIATGLSMGMFLFSWGLGFYSVKKKEDSTAAQGSNGADKT
ncbi:Putative major facilitator superfamily, MFS transporter superfamily [Colletotrichum destructivum]|uniref:Major facilitator superfamily, MFS transporter superfamily n=1 Tax=Colletotrichum destructivum TaxID=34406 RepID=A0AAX4I5M0_9PEZI|nr:Putative major facilitator superfamily, MFS transporter superfamily [Colletotrichum destructivum]